VKVPATSDVAPSSGKKSKTHPPKPYDNVQGMERVIDMMEETLQICERAQRSTQDASHRMTFSFGLWPPSDVYTRQAMKSIQIQSGRQQPSSDLKVESRARRAPLDVPCIYHKGAWHTLRVCRLQKKIDQERDVSRATQAPTSPDGSEFQKAWIRISPTARDPLGGASYWSQLTTRRGSARRIPRRRVGSKPTRTTPRGGRRSGARRYPRVPATYVSSSNRQGSRRSTTRRPTWVWCWHVSSRPILRPRPKLPWPTSGSPLLW
jgi:hypothetical protein